MRARWKSRPNFNAIECGMENFIHQIVGLAGKSATLKLKEERAACKLVYLTVDTEIGVTPDEAVLRNGNPMGEITSRGFSPRSKKSMAFAYVSIDITSAETRL